MSLGSLAAAIIFDATARIVMADSDTVTFDHVAVDAIIAVGGALEVAATDQASALLILRVTRELLLELPPESGHGVLPDLLRQRALAYARESDAR